jgi:hypothetical protein
MRGLLKMVGGPRRDAEFLARENAVGGVLEPGWTGHQVVIGLVVCATTLARRDSANDARYTWVSARPGAIMCPCCSAEQGSGRPMFLW